MTSTIIDRQITNTLNKAAPSITLELSSKIFTINAGNGASNSQIQIGKWVLLQKRITPADACVVGAPALARGWKSLILLGISRVGAILV